MPSLNYISETSPPPLGTLRLRLSHTAGKWQGLGLVDSSVSAVGPPLFLPLDSTLIPLVPSVCQLWEKEVGFMAYVRSGLD